MILRLWAEKISNAHDLGQDPKTALQEWAQARGLNPPDYQDVDRKGPDHAPTFSVEVILQDGNSSRASASSKRAAQQLAAADLLARLETADG